MLAEIFSIPVVPKDSLAAVSRAAVDAMLTVWLSFLVFAGRDWSHLFPACESLARCCGGFSVHCSAD
jgi:hypothetical protein